MQVSKKSSRKSLWLLLLLLALTAMGVYLAKDYMAKNSAASQSLKAQINRINSQHATLGKNLPVAIQNDNQLPTTGSDMQPAPVVKLQGQDLVQVKQAYFLTQLAQDRLRFARDVPTAVQLLQSAQEQLQSLTNPELTSIKSSLMQDQSKLSALQYPDLDQLQAKLDALDKLVPSLSEKQASTTTVDSKNLVNKNIPKTEQLEPGIQGYVNNILAYFKSVVKVRKNTDPDLGVVALNVEISKAQLRLQIEQMRWAAFYHDTDVFQKSIKRAQGILALVFPGNNESAIHFAQELADLSKVQVQPDVPSLQDALTTFHKLLIG